MYIKPLNFKEKDEIDYLCKNFALFQRNQRMFSYRPCYGYKRVKTTHEDIRICRLFTQRIQSKKGGIFIEKNTEKIYGFWAFGGIQHMCYENPCGILITFEVLETAPEREEMIQHIKTKASILKYKYPNLNVYLRAPSWLSSYFGTDTEYVMGSYYIPL